MSSKLKKKRSFSWRAMWNYKCPRCQKGDMFVEPFEFSNPTNMNKKCSECGLDFEPEPGFYFGALIISYGISSWLLLLPALLLTLYFKWSVGSAMALAIGVTALVYFRLMRVSRSFYLHTSIRYDSSLEKSENSASKYDNTLW